MPCHSKKSAKFQLFLNTEIWALCFVLVCQEIPFFTIRLFKLIKFNKASRDYSIYFYVAKNFILCIFEIYRIIIIFYYHRKHSGGESSSPKHLETIGSMQVSNKTNQPSSNPIEKKSIFTKLSNKIFTIRMQPTESMEYINLT
jgi:hypothetical protein